MANTAATEDENSSIFGVGVGEAESNVTELEVGIQIA